MLKRIVAIVRVALGGIALMALPVAASGQAATLQLADAGALPYKMQMHGTAIMGDRMYVFGGDLDGGAKTTLWTQNVRSAPLDLSTCKVGAWREEAPLPDLRSYMNNCVEVVNDRIYIVGGNVASDPKVELSAKRVNTVAWTRRGGDGHLEPWKLSAPYPGEPVMMGATCSSDKFLMILGGLGTSGAVDQIMVSSFSPDGTPTDWRVGGKLPIPLLNHGACIQANKIYVWGGRLTDKRLNLEAWSADISADGAVSNWSPENAIPSGVQGAACCGINDYLVSIGGFTSANAGSTNIWFARLQDKHITQWQALDTNLKTHVYHGLGLQKDNGWVLVTGGQNKKLATGANGQILDAIQAFQIPKAASSDMARGMQKIDKATAQARATGKKSIIFFYSPVVPACQRIWNEAINKSTFATLAGDRVIGAGNTSDKNDSAWAYKMGVYRVPCLVELSADGDVLRRSDVLDSPTEVEVFLKGQ